MSKVSENVSYSVPALEKSISIIECLAQSTDGLSLSAICKKLDLPKTSVYAILCTLEAHNYIRKNPGGTYNLGLSFYSLGMLSVRHIDSKQLFVPHLEALRNETTYTVHLCTYDNGESVCLEKIEGLSTIRFLSYVGERKLMNVSACGKAMAAYLPEKELQVMFSKGMLSLTPNSINTEQAFREHLEQIRQYGYSIDDEEGEMGVRCVGAPIFTEGHQVFGAISVSTLKGNLPMQKIPEYGEKLIQTAKIISASLGYK
ncbi:IclR family transcriptional regulator [Paenibacillus nasutitermitis]|uniref:IclR family transcriptional regulator n=1 Tax=Paenibacillus nasutitermitis TaxID=1652958 RepID=A0A916ZIC5_9BACL|nr:IclR family transcriptional regulator [Paenibacillus nasutitermitis]GGD98344.1 IclR family transcriptional regulator [Paenibacillus nasutitermitis]